MTEEDSAEHVRGTVPMRRGGWITPLPGASVHS